MSDMEASVAVQQHSEFQMHKRFTFWTALGIAISASGAWEGWIASMAQGIIAGSAAGLFWGWIFVSVGITSMACSLAELVSMWPSAGGQYVWTAKLAPPRFRAILSYYVAWLGITGSWLGAISCAMGVALQIQSYVAVSQTYSIHRWHAFLIATASMALWMVTNIFWTKGIHIMNSGILYLHGVGFLAVVITLAVCTPTKHDAKWVFTHFDNETGWSSDGIAWCIGLLPALYAFFSLDTASHYSEEIPDANVAVPRAMFIQAALNSVMTIPFIITVLFCIGDPLDVLYNSQIGFMSPFTQIVLNSTGSPAAAVILNVISTYVAFAAGLDLWGAAGRMIWSLARDRGLPAIFTRLHPKYDVPIPALLVMFVPGMIITMIYIFNTTAFYGIMAGVLVAFQLSYVVPIALNLLYARPRMSLTKGPWSMGRFGPWFDVVSLCFGIFMVIFMSFPSYQPVTAATMNYAVAIIGVVMIFATAVYFLYAKGRYTGPPTTEVIVGAEGEASTRRSDDNQTSLESVMGKA